MIFTLPRPEAGAEIDVVWHRHHDCPSAEAFIVALEAPDIDLLQFSVGLIGYEMPLDIPFAVDASNACGVCGEMPTAWFRWKGAKIWVPGDR